MCVREREREWVSWRVYRTGMHCCTYHFCYNILLLAVVEHVFCFDLVDVRFDFRESISISISISFSFLRRTVLYRTFDSIDTQSHHPERHVPECQSRKFLPRWWRHAQRPRPWWCKWQGIAVVWQASSAARSSSFHGSSSSWNTHTRNSIILSYVRQYGSWYDMLSIQGQYLVLYLQWCEMQSNENWDVVDGNNKDVNLYELLETRQQGTKKMK